MKTEPVFKLTPKRVLLLALVVAAASCITGCAAFDVDEQWDPVPKHKPLPHTYVYYPFHELPSRCSWQPALGTYIYGCASRDYAAGVCRILTHINIAPWEREHEEKHCAGYSHPVLHATRTVRN